MVVDHYSGRVFDDSDEAGDFAESIGFSPLMRIAEDAVKGCPTGSSPLDSPMAVAWPNSLPQGDLSGAC